MYLHDPERTGSLVAEVGEVIGEGLDRLCRVAGLGVLAVVADEDGLFRLDDADSCLALAAVHAPVPDPRGHVALAGDVNALGIGLVYRRLVLLVKVGQDGDEVLELIGSDREIGRRSPGAVAGGADDAGLVDVAGANEACRVC
jgi:hypothetical protein